MEKKLYLVKISFINIDSGYTSSEYELVNAENEDKAKEIVEKLYDTPDTILNIKMLILVKTIKE